MHSAAEPLSATWAEPPFALLAGEILDAWTGDLNGEGLDALTVGDLVSHDRSRLAPLALARELEYASGANSSVCIPKTRIGLFDYSEPTRTEPFPYASVCTHRASLDVWPELASGTRFMLSQDTYRGQEVSPPSTHRYVYTLNNPVKYTDPSGMNPYLIAIGAILVASSAIPFYYALLSYRDRDWDSWSIFTLAWALSFFPGMYLLFSAIPGALVRIEVILATASRAIGLFECALVAVIALRRGWEGVDEKIAIIAAIYCTLVGA